MCGLESMVAVLLLLLRRRGVSGEVVQQWETSIVLGAAAAGVGLWIVKRRQP